MIVRMMHWIWIAIAWCSLLNLCLPFSPKKERMVREAKRCVVWQVDQEQRDSAHMYYGFLYKEGKLSEALIDSLRIQYADKLPEYLQSRSNYQDYMAYKYVKNLKRGKHICYNMSYERDLVVYIYLYEKNNFATTAGPKKQRKSHTAR